MIKSVIYKQNISKYNDTLRLDAEHYQEKYINIRNILEGMDSVKLKDIISKPIVTGHTPSMAKEDIYYGGDVNFVKTDNLRDFYISDNFSHKLTTEGNKEIQRSVLQENDIIITIIGATHDIVGRASLVTAEMLPANINQNIALIRLKNCISPEYVTAYLNTKYGKGYLWHLSRQTEQVNLNCREVENVLVPILKNISSVIAQTVNLSYSIRNQSKVLFQQAENILLCELGLDSYIPKTSVSFVKYSDEVIQAKRIDADYFQPKYYEIIEHLKNYNEGWAFWNQIIETKDINIKPDNDTEYKYIELSNIGLSGEINSCMHDYGNNLPSRARRRVRANDVIVSSIEGSLDSIALIPDEYDNALCSTGFYVICSQNINSQTLFVFLKSIAGQLQLKRGCSGTILTAINKEAIGNIIIPKFSNRVQQSIKQKIDELTICRSKFLFLLNLSKLSIEMAIEQGEEKALKWINAELDKLGVKLNA